MIFLLRGHAALKRKELQTAQQKLSDRQRRGIHLKVRHRTDSPWRTWGNAPGLRKSENISAEGAIHLRLNSMREYANCPKPFSIVCRRALRLRIESRELNRAFSAWPSGPIEFLGRCPQARADKAPLALNMHEQDALRCTLESCNSQIHRA
jgi:curved DNA-binding protein CbpA